MIALPDVQDVGGSRSGREQRLVVDVKYVSLSVLCKS